MFIPLLIGLRGIVGTRNAIIRRQSNWAPLKWSQHPHPSSTPSASATPSAAAAAPHRRWRCAKRGRRPRLIVRVKTDRRHRFNEAASQRRVCGCVRECDIAWRLLESRFVWSHPTTHINYMFLIYTAYQLIYTAYQFCHKIEAHSIKEVVVCVPRIDSEIRNIREFSEYMATREHILYSSHRVILIWNVYSRSEQRIQQSLNPITHYGLRGVQIPQNVVTPEHF